MNLTGQTTSAPIVALFFMAHYAVSAAAAEPTPTPTPCATRGEVHLGEYADRTTLDRTGLAAPGEPVVITNQTVSEVAEHGLLTTCTPPFRATGHPADGDRASTKAIDAKRRSYWRRRIDEQRDRVARVAAELARADAKIESLEEAAFHGGRNAARTWARVDEARRQRRIVEGLHQREKARLDAIFREARLEGAQPGWFR
jgi:hypothetical protein